MLQPSFNLFSRGQASRLVLTCMKYLQVFFRCHLYSGHELLYVAVQKYKINLLNIKKGFAAGCRGACL